MDSIIIDENYNNTNKNNFNDNINNNVNNQQPSQEQQQLDQSQSQPQSQQKPPKQQQQQQNSINVNNITYQLYNSYQANNSNSIEEKYSKYDPNYPGGEDGTDESKPWNYFFEDYPFPHKHMTRIMSLKNKVEHYIKNKIRLPDEYRTKIWSLMEDLDKLVNNDNNKNIYKTCLETPNEEIENDVRTDAVRTFPSSQYKIKMKDKQFQSKDSLFKVLKSYAIYNEEVQYTQGMNYLCLVLLCYFYEEESFWMMDLLIKKHGMRHFFKKKSYLPSYLTIFEKELENHLPTLAKHLSNEGVQMYMFIQGWWSTIFVYILPVETISTIWDYFFWGANGMAIEVLFRLSIALLKMLEKELLKVGMSDFFETLKDNSQNIDSLELVYQAYSIHLSDKTDYFLREVILNYKEEEMNDNIFDFQKLLSTIYEETVDQNQLHIQNKNKIKTNSRNQSYYDDDEDEEYIDYDDYYRKSVLVDESSDSDDNYNNKTPCIIS
ncbi:hypothetical protein DICPUDRAFT_153314 [Dictyostelium purpureum]|uniref:Rab-GAP TBC domain-containing protein n=1 Tax=Dictyostelium purpureum TaxID=5786 RepID=F0ZNK8_DICPU|nr:uncharacterized protein DICPUDRAFT_153314 [Dictyostelium purpureum]EGC34476.1 hypothetical protein DICPUDRAFT_153314 [Dictyostelium purpureum]|eukprot:XP_003289011.1 hypothetical protein DICPUDRAFT_153314 [Dictyostelium purpureum]